MFEKIIFISNEVAKVTVNGALENNIMNMHVIFEDNTRLILGQIQDMNDVVVTINFLGELINNEFVSGVTMKPSLILMTLETAMRLVVSIYLQPQT